LGGPPADARRLAATGKASTAKTDRCSAAGLTIKRCERYIATTGRGGRYMLGCSEKSSTSSQACMAIGSANQTITPPPKSRNCRVGGIQPHPPGSTGKRHRPAIEGLLQRRRPIEPYWAQWSGGTTMCSRRWIGVWTSRASEPGHAVYSPCLGGKGGTDAVGTWVLYDIQGAAGPKACLESLQKSLAKKWLRHVGIFQLRAKATGGGGLSFPPRGRAIGKKRLSGGRAFR